MVMVRPLEAVTYKDVEKVVGDYVSYRPPLRMMSPQRAQCDGCGSRAEEVRHGLIRCAHCGGAKR